MYINFYGNYCTPTEQLAISFGTVEFIVTISIKLESYPSYPLLVINSEQMLLCDTQHAEVKL